MAMLTMIVHVHALLVPVEWRRQSRRTVVQHVGAAISLLAPALKTSALDPSTSVAEVEPPKFQKIPGGGQYADLKKGTGPEVTAGSKVSMQWVLRRSNGYYVDGSVKLLSGQGGAITVADNFDEKDNFVFTVGDGRAIAGLDEGVRGMRQGGVRRLVLPISRAYSLPLEKSGGPLPDGFGPRRQIEREIQRQDPYNYFYLEVQATRVR